MKGGGCMRELKNQTTPDPTNVALWTIYATVEDKNKQFPSTIKISLQAKSSYKISGNYWKNLALPLINVRYSSSNYDSFDFITINIFFFN